VPEIVEPDLRQLRLLEQRLPDAACEILSAQRPAFAITKDELGLGLGGFLVTSEGSARRRG
jgi:hypothetical protein